MAIAEAYPDTIAMTLVTYPGRCAGSCPAASQMASQRPSASTRNSGRSRRSRRPSAAMTNNPATSTASESFWWPTMATTTAEVMSGHRAESSRTTNASGTAAMTNEDTRPPGTRPVMPRPATSTTTDATTDSDSVNAGRRSPRWASSAWNETTVTPAARMWSKPAMAT